MEIEHLVGKTIKKVKEGVEGLNILLTNGDKLVLSQSTFPDGTYDKSSLDELKNINDADI